MPIVNLEGKDVQVFLRNGEVGSISGTVTEVEDLGLYIQHRNHGTAAFIPWTSVVNLRWRVASPNGSYRRELMP